MVIGIGIGLIIGSILMSISPISSNLSKAEVEKKARDLGMNYPTEFKVNTK